MKTPEQLADEYAQTWWGPRQDYSSIATRQGFLAGYRAAMEKSTEIARARSYQSFAEQGMSDKESMIMFNNPAHEVMRIVPTETGFDVVVADGITMTEAAEQFVKTVRALINNDVTFSLASSKV